MKKRLNKIISIIVVFVISILTLTTLSFYGINSKYNRLSEQISNSIKSEPMTKYLSDNEKTNFSEFSKTFDPNMDSKTQNQLEAKYNRDQVISKVFSSDILVYNLMLLVNSYVTVFNVPKFDSFFANNVDTVNEFLTLQTIIGTTPRGIAVSMAEGLISDFISDENTREIVANILIDLSQDFYISDTEDNKIDQTWSWRTSLFINTNIFKTAQDESLNYNFLNYLKHSGGNTSYVIFKYLNESTQDVLNQGITYDNYGYSKSGLSLTKKELTIKSTENVDTMYEAVLYNSWKSNTWKEMWVRTLKHQGMEEFNAKDIFVTFESGEENKFVENDLSDNTYFSEENQDLTFSQYLFLCRYYEPSIRSWNIDQFIDVFAHAAAHNIKFFELERSKI